MDKQTKGLIEILESTVWRREAMAEKAAARRASLTCSSSSMGTPKTPQLAKSMQNKRRDNRKNDEWPRILLSCFRARISASNFYN